MPAVDVDERHQDEVDAFIARNRGALNTSLRRSREEVGKGVKARRTITDIIVDGRKRHDAA
jgi:hypothetical protein